MSRTCLVIGGTGAQGSAVVRSLASPPNTYTVKILTRNASSSHAQDLLSFSPSISLIEGNCFNEDDLLKAFQGVDSCFINTDGFAIGEMREVYWGIRMYEIAAWAGVRHFVYGGLDYCGRKAGFDPVYRCGHYDGKGKVGDFLKSQPTTSMMWSSLSSGPYIESLDEYYRPEVDENGIYVFRLPLAQGAMPLIHLEDLGTYARWILDNPSQSSGMELEIATVHASGEDIVTAFTAVTGKPARYDAADLGTFMREFWAGLPQGQNTKIASRYVGEDDETLMSYGQNFTAWWNIYQASGGNKGIIKRDYELLDRIFPGRVRSVEEWMKKTGYKGELKPLLKDWAERSSERK